jgi:hypothetical protein
MGIVPSYSNFCKQALGCSRLAKLIDTFGEDVMIYALHYPKILYWLQGITLSLFQNILNKDFGTKGILGGKGNFMFLQVLKNVRETNSGYLKNNEL